MTALVLLFLISPAHTHAQEVIYQPGKDIRDPVLIREVKPIYTEDAKNRKVQGSVELSVVVRADGSVGDTQVTRSLDPDLDQEAIKAARQWRFRPGTKDGDPVNVQVAIEMSFTLRDAAPVYKVSSAGVTAPKATKIVNPDYDDSARQERIEGTVELEGIVEQNGAISAVHVVKSLDERLDRQALKALRQWQFSPGQKDGVAVRVQVRVEMSFTVK